MLLPGQEKSEDDEESEAAQPLLQLLLTPFNRWPKELSPLVMEAREARSPPDPATTESGGVEATGGAEVPIVVSNDDEGNSQTQTQTTQLVGPGNTAAALAVPSEEQRAAAAGRSNRRRKQQGPKRCVKRAKK